MALERNNNPWVAPNLGAPPPRHPRGMWLNYRKLASSGYVMPRRERMKLLGGEPHGIPIEWSLAAQQTLEFQGVAPGYFLAMSLMANSRQAAGFQALLYDPFRKRQFSERPLDNPNLGGTGRQQLILRTAYPFDPKTPILARVTNLATVQNDGQIVVWGFIFPDRPNLGEPEPGKTLESEGKNYSLVEQPPWVERPASGESIDPAEAIALPAIGATATILQFRVPPGRSGVIKRLGNEVVGGGWVNGDGNLIWQILINGAAVKNFERIVMSVGTVPDPRSIAGIRLRETDLVQFTVFNNPNGPTGGVPVAGQLVLATLGGWFYPKELDPENLW